MTLITVFFIMLTTGCATINNNNAASDVNTELSTVNSVSSDESITVQEYLPVGCYGEEAYIFNKDFSQQIIINEAMENIEDSLPVYINKYPFGQEGPLFKISSEDKEALKLNLISFLNILNKTQDSENLDYNIEFNPDIIHLAFYNAKNIEIAADWGSVSILTSNYNIIENIKNNTFLDNQLVKAALEYSNISNPIVENYTTYNQNGDVYEYVYKITESRNGELNDIWYSTYKCIFISCGYDATEALIRSRNIDTPELYRNVKIISPERALDFISDKYKDINTGNAITEVFYSLSIQPGYFIPCYKIYIPDNSSFENDELRQYSVYYVPMIDKNEKIFFLVIN